MPTVPPFSTLAWNFSKIWPLRIKKFNWVEHLGLTLKCLLLIWNVSGPDCPCSYWFIWNVTFTLYIMYKLENEKCVNNIVWNKPGLVFSLDKIPLCTSVIFEIAHSRLFSLKENKYFYSVNGILEPSHIDTTIFWLFKMCLKLWSQDELLPRVNKAYNLLNWWADNIFRGVLKSHTLCTYMYIHVYSVFHMSLRPVLEVGLSSGWLRVCFPVRRPWDPVLAGSVPAVMSQDSTTSFLVLKNQ